MLAVLMKGWEEEICCFHCNEIFENLRRFRPPVSYSPKRTVGCPCRIGAFRAFRAKKEVLLILPYLGLQRRILTKQVKACINKFYCCFNLRVAFQRTHRIKSLFPYKDRLTRAQMSKVVYKGLAVGTAMSST